MSEPRGSIRDVGYRRYVGTRLPASTRWRVIVRYQLATAWQGWWRYKAWLVAALGVAIVVGVMMYLWRTQLAPHLMRGGMPVTWADALLPAASPWLGRAAFVVTLTVGAGAIAGDTGTGAFVFYFSRPVRPIDYLAGKLGALLVLMGGLVLAPLVALALFRVGLLRERGEVVSSLLLVPKAIGVGAVGALAFAALPLGFSAVIDRRRNAIIAWVAYYVALGMVARGIGLVTGWPLGAIDPSFAFEAVATAAFDIEAPVFRGKPGLPSLGWALASLLGQSALAIGLAHARIRARAHAGIGGAS